MLLSRMAAELNKKYSGIHAVIPGDCLLSHLLFLGKEGTFQKDALYVIFGERAVFRNTFPRNLLVIYQDDEERHTLEDHLSHCGGLSNLLYVPREEHEQVINEIQEFLQQSRSHGDSYSEFLRMVIDGRDLCHLLAEGARQCGRQLIALDNSGKIQGYSPKQDYLTSDWVLALKNGYCPVDFMEHLHELLLTRTEITSTPFTYLCDQGKLTYLSSPVVINGSSYGYVFLLSEKDDFDPVAYDILPVLSKVVGDYLQRSNQGLDNRNQVFHDLVRDILHGEAPDSVRSRVASGRLPIPEVMRVLVVHFYYAERERESLKALSTQLSVFFGPFAPLRHENRLVLLQNMDPRQSKHNAKAMELLQQLAVSNRLYVGISNEFSRIDRFAEYYEEAEEALKLSSRLHREGNLVYYQDVAFYSLLCKIPSSEKLKSFCHPALEVLQRYDAENGTDLMETLRVYIKTNCNQKLTSEIMYAHRNTISYRRQQIIDLTGIDFSNVDTLFQLIYSFKIYQFLET